MITVTVVILAAMTITVVTALIVDGCVGSSESICSYDSSDSCNCGDRIDRSESSDIV